MPWIHGGSGAAASFPPAAGVTADLAARTAFGDGADVLSSIEYLTGSRHDDMLYGSGAANVIKGGIGNDYLNGRGGDDELYGNSGLDTADGSRGTDLCRAETTIACEL